MPRHTVRLLVALACVHAAAAAAPQPPPGQGVTGSIRGSVRVLRPAAAPVRRPSVGGLGLSQAPLAADSARPIVYLEKAPAGAFEERGAGRSRMTQRNETFLPSVLAIHAGASVDFPNEDQTYHNVFSLSRALRFDLGRYATGQSKAVRFEQPGIVRVFCDIHSHMSAFILVFNHRYFDAAGPDDRYAIDAVPPGRYTVAAWHDGMVRGVQTVMVPDDGGAVELNFELR